MRIKKLVFGLVLFLGVMLSMTTMTHAYTTSGIGYRDNGPRVELYVNDSYTWDFFDIYQLDSSRVTIDVRDYSAYEQSNTYTIHMLGNGTEFITHENVLKVDFYPNGGYMWFWDQNGNEIEYDFSDQGNYSIYWSVVEPDSAPVLSGETVFVTTVDDPITETEIRSYISAYDETDGNITHLIQLVSDNYTANSSTLGSYNIAYRVSDSAGNIANLTVTVMVKDVLSPSWNTSKSTASISYTQTFDIEAYKAQLGASDNYYASNELTISINSNTYTANKTVPGTYEVVYKILDPSDNYTLAAVDITVFDDVDPVFSGPSIITKATTQAMTISDIKAELTANDAIDGNLTTSIQVVSDNFTGRGNRVGSYDVEFSVTDNSGNIAYHTVTVQVTDDIPPVFYVKDGYFVTVSQSIALSRQDFIDILVVTGQITVDGTGGVEILTLVNEYEGNETTPGIYALSFKVVSLSGNESIHNMAVEVMETTDDTVDVIEETTFIDDLVQTIKDNITYVIVGLVLIISIGYGISKMKKTKKRNKRK